ncbi:sensor histidine kinase [Ningiella sp. W23]|uniref:sensor histidine kinase n=1 Tax=Ningiella sp. W23 TaxID=3023715 RepID=UPI003758018D
MNRYSSFTKGLLMFSSLRDKHRFLSNYPRMRTWQVAFWGFLCVVTFFTLTLWYSQASIIYIIPVIVQSAIGLLFSLILQRAIIFFWQIELFTKLILNLVSVSLVSLIWTIARMYVFELTTGETHIWTEFGGWYFSSIFIFTSWTALFYGIQYYRLLQEKNKDMLHAEAKAQEAQLVRMQAQATARDAQLQMLRYQLNPHFLCNTLNAINALIDMEENEKAQMMTVNLSQFLRFSLDNIPEGKTSLKKEIETLSLYLKIEKTRFEDRLQLDFDIQREAENALVPSLLLQPIIENSMKHAIAKCEKGGTIRVQASVVDNYLHLSVSDSGNGQENIDAAGDQAFHKGVGLENTEQRLKILYTDKFTLDVGPSSFGGCKTMISIPLELSMSEQKSKSEKDIV